MIPPDRIRRSRRPGVEPLEGRALLSVDVGLYNIGTPTLTNIWVDPVHGSDANTGAVRGQALRSLDAAWRRVPQDTTLTTTGYHILLTAGDYAAGLLPSGSWTSDRRGTYACPVIIEAADGPLTARLHGPLNCQNDSYLYLIGLNFVTDPGAAGGGNTLQIASDDHVLVRSCIINGYDGTTRQPQEAFKGNQCQYVYVEACDVSGGFWFGLDFVGVQYGHILSTHIHNTGDDGLVLKGGTAQFTVQGCVIDDIGNVGIAAGQGSGFEFMVAPWIHYEAYDLKFINNVVHDVQNAGLAVRGGYNILAADNTFYRIGQSGGSGSSLLLFSPGGRTCDGDSAACTARHNLGGWGPTAVGDGGEWIPNKNIFIYNNIFANPSGAASMWGDFDVAAPVDVPAYSNIPSPASSFDNVVIRGNILWNGAADHDLGTTNPALIAQLTADNAIGTINPQLVNPAAGDYRPAPGGNVFSRAAVAIPSFPGGDLPTTPRAPTGDLTNLVALDKQGNWRTTLSPPGAFIAAASPRPTPLDILIHRYPGSNQSVVNPLAPVVAPQTVQAAPAARPLVVQAAPAAKPLVVVVPPAQGIRPPGREAGRSWGAHHHVHGEHRPRAAFRGRFRASH